MITPAKPSVDEASVRYQARTKLTELAGEIASVRDLNKVSDKFLTVTKIRLWLKALDYNFLSSVQRERIVYAIIQLSGIYEFPAAPVLANMPRPDILLGGEGGGVTGIPAGGTTGQVLTKSSNNNYVTYWGDPSKGHVIYDQANTSLAQRLGLKFERLISTDNAGTDQTVVKRPADTYVGVSPPVSPLEGDIWTNTNTWRSYKYYDSFWVEIPSGSHSGVLGVTGTGTVNGITLTGAVTSTGYLTLGGALTDVDINAQTIGILPVSRGGTGLTTITGVMIGTGSSIVTQVGTAGQLLRKRLDNSGYEFFTLQEAQIANASITGYLLNTDWVNFNTAYNDKINSAAVTGTTTKTLTLTQQDNTTITASWTDLAGGGSVGTNDLNKSNGSGGFSQSYIFSSSSGNLTLGDSTLASFRTLTTDGSASNVSLYIRPKGTGSVILTNNFGGAGDFRELTVGVNTISLDNVTSASVSLRTFLYTDRFSVNKKTANTNTVEYALDITNESSGTPTVGIGTGFRFLTQTAAGNYEYGSAIESVSTDVTSTSEDFDLVFKTMQNGATASEKLRLDSKGNQGLGVTPSAWNTNYRGLEVGAIGSGFMSKSGEANLYINANAYYDTGATWRYGYTDLASAYQQFAGTHRWLIAPSGTAGQPITFTQAMTLDSSGRLGIGVIPSYKLHVETSDQIVFLGRSTQASGYSSLRLYNDQNNALRALEIDYFGSTASGGERAEIFVTGAYPLAFGTSNTERMRITSGGQLKLNNYTSTSSFTGTVAGYLAFDSNGNILTSSGSGGGATPPGGSNTQVQFNDNGSFAGSSNFTWDKTTNKLRINSFTGGATDRLVGADSNNDLFAILIGTGLSYNVSTKTLSVSSTSGGTVTSVSVVSANGLAGTVATSSSTPAITLSTTVTGILKGDGTSISAATAGTDYVTPAALDAYLLLTGGTMTGAITTPNNAVGIIIGDDSKLADRNVGNTLFLEGGQNSDRGYINFSSTSGNALGALTGGSLTWRGNVVWHEGNDGTTSGLDADLLDGNHASAFALASHTHPYLPLAGGTMTGNIAFGYDTNYGITWSAQSDSATITFESTGDGSTGDRANSNLLINLSDNSNEGLRVINTPYNAGAIELLYLNTNLFEYKGSKVWHAGNDGSGSGLDADTVDGYDSSSLLRLFSGSSNLDTATADGTYFYSDSTASRPNNYGVVLSVSSGGVAWYNQLAFGTDGSTFAWRSNINSGGWSGWRNIWHDGNTDAIRRPYGSASYYTASSIIEWTNRWDGLLWTSNAGSDQINAGMSSSASFSLNSVGTYSPLRISGTKNLYGGFYDDISGVNVMFASGGNGGFYKQAGGKWYVYWNNGDNCLGVNGSTTSSTYALYVNGKGIYSAGDVVAFSDERKKENIETIDNALSIVNNLRGVYYNKKDDEHKKRLTGVIAQETNRYFPEVVTYENQKDEYGVAYGNMAGLFIEAMKEMKTKIESLENELKTLKGI